MDFLIHGHGSMDEKMPPVHKLSSFSLRIFLQHRNHPFSLRKKSNFNPCPETTSFSLLSLFGLVHWHIYGGGARCPRRYTDILQKLVHVLG